VIHGEAPSDLLASYGPERQAVAKRVVRDTDIQTRAWMVRRRSEVAVRNAAFRAADRTGMASRLYAPVMAGRRIAYPAERPTQRPSGRPACRLRGKLPGRLRIGAVFPRELALRHGFAGPDADPLAWTLVAACRGATAGWRTDLLTLAGDWPRVDVVPVDVIEARGHTGCAENGYYLIRPDGHTAAHGHAGDLDRLRAELTSLLGAPRRAAALAAA
jgi:3-(3-hydroxy-phenyl)propionate hydroxylase